MTMATGTIDISLAEIKGKIQNSILDTPRSDMLPNHPVLWLSSHCTEIVDLPVVLIGLNP